MSENRVHSESIWAPLLQKLEDYKVLVKFRLNLFVVFSAVSAYVVASGGVFRWEALVLLGLGGFLVTGSANALNEVLEKDFDRMMKRTADRPLPAGRMSSSEAVLMAGFMAVIGLFLLALFNPLTSVLGSFAIVLYAFIYTPLKRFSQIAVAVGALPGALPVLIGAVAYSGGFTQEALLMFAIQFLWQFPHFWAIGWVAFDDYAAAGYKLVPERDGAPDPRIGMQSLVYTLFLFPVVFFSYYTGLLHLPGAIALGVFTAAFAWMSWRLHVERDRASARRLMFASFFYLPMALITYLICNL